MFDFLVHVHYLVLKLLCYSDSHFAIDMPLVPPYIESLRPYVPGKPIEELQRELGVDRIVKLASNENPLGPSPKAIEEMQKRMQDIHYYPDESYDLRVLLAKKFHLKVDNVIVGSGSEGIISNIIRTFLCDDDEVLTTEAAFIGFQVVAKSRGVTYRTVPYKDWRYDLRGIAEQINEHTKIIYLANPNNPTGTIITKQEFDEFYKHVPERVLIILDEAYYEYAKDNYYYPDSMDYRYDNVITLRTFSKVYGLAGIRIGYGFAHNELIRNLLKVKLPFEPNVLAQAAGIGALKDEDFLRRSLEMNAKGLKLLMDQLKQLDVQVVPSDANFVMVVRDSEDDVNYIFQELLKQGVIVRPLKAFGLPHCIRISVGTEEEIKILLGALKKVLAKAYV